VSQSLDGSKSAKWEISPAGRLSDALKAGIRNVLRSASIGVDIISLPRRRGEDGTSYENLKI
jgi:hypothetical protein